MINEAGRKATDWQNTHYSPCCKNWHTQNEPMNRLLPTSSRLTTDLTERGVVVVDSRRLPRVFVGCSLKLWLAKSNLHTTKTHTEKINEQLTKRGVSQGLRISTRSAEFKLDYCMQHLQPLLPLLLRLVVLLLFGVDFVLLPGTDQRNELNERTAVARSSSSSFVSRSHHNI